MRKKNKRSSWLFFSGVVYIALLTCIHLLPGLSLQPSHFWRLARRKGFQISIAVKCGWRCALHGPEHTKFLAPEALATKSCPQFFSWMQDDLAPWLISGIQEQDLEEARLKASFRAVIKDGRLYYEKYSECFQSRGLLTLWGLLMLLERFPGQVPDVDLMFSCADTTAIPRSTLRPVPLFGYATDIASYDIPFPDWSFWGWPELNIETWEREGALIFANEINPWGYRKNFAHWKGNLEVARIRKDLLKCNETGISEIYAQDWIAETNHKFMSSKLPQQCEHRYKIYAEGNTWSVSFKYIMACGSTVLDIQHKYHDFFTRSLLPWLHFVPVERQRDQLCSSLKDAVLWGNEHPAEAEEIGKHGQAFLKKDLTMAHVYDYMFHLLRQYSELLNFQPEIPPGAMLLCPSYLICTAKDEHREHLKGLKIPEPATPCMLT